MGIRQKIVLFLASYFIIFAGSSLIAITLDEILANPNSGQSQSESYLRTLGNNKSEIFDRIKNTLIAPPVINGQVKDKGNPSAYTRIDPAKFEDLIVKAILEEQSHPNDYYFYHSTQKAGIALAMLRTAIDQQINNWNRDDFLIIRDKRFFYPIRARTASDYFKQNIPYNTRFKDPETEALLKENSVGIDRQIFFIKAWDRKAQFDFISPYRDHLVSVSPAFIAGVDDTSNEKRNSYDMDWAAWESSFYYFATDLSWSNADRLYGFFLDDLKLQNPNLFSNKKEAVLVRKYLAISFALIMELFSELDKKLGNIGMMIQFVIPKDLVDNVSYISWVNGTMLQSRLENYEPGFDNNIGAYTKASHVLDALKSKPKDLGFGINLLQARIILKDEEYFSDPTSRVKMHVIHALPNSDFNNVKEAIDLMARVIVAFNKGLSPEETNYINELQKNLEPRLEDLLNSDNEKNIISGLTILSYYGKTQVFNPLMNDLEIKFGTYLNPEIRRLVNSIVEAREKLSKTP